MNKNLKTKKLSLFLVLTTILSIFFSNTIVFAANNLSSSVIFATNSQIKYFDFKKSQFTPPPRTDFSWFNKNIVSVHTPHHNGYDSIVTTNESQYIEGKFQYGDFNKDLENEWISIYEYSLDSSTSHWEKLTRLKTNSDGRVKYTIPNSMKLAPGLHLIKLYVEGDGTEANMYLQVLDTSKKYVIFDIDGTLTTSDFENVKEYTSELTNINYIPQMYSNANDVAKYYSSKGYNILYLTARPYWLTENSQRWLLEKGFPMGLVHTSYGSSLLIGQAAADYKANYLKQLQTKGIQFCYGYGNAQSDVQAYSNVGINKSNIFIIGSEAGVLGSTPITTYSEHLKILH
ncbi:HAD family acid phosphatase [Clostridium sp. HBUAS56017]|uniref:LNS2 domain-containing protein n=1 Tax=Clostridium sp. HBUAS56017 TaxID=2571128 RepID=UPI001177BDEF|nr:HAD family acid phosphatase [Clostridium sp. HBUAS56017]